MNVYYYRIFSEILKGGILLSQLQNTIQMEAVNIIHSAIAYTAYFKQIFVNWNVSLATCASHIEGGSIHRYLLDKINVVQNSLPLVDVASSKSKSKYNIVLRKRCIFLITQNMYDPDFQWQFLRIFGRCPSIKVSTDLFRLYMFYTQA